MFSSMAYAAVPDITFARNVGMTTQILTAIHLKTLPQQELIVYAT
jgi:hypothetical protein